jgi:chemotaxis protein histidine kinase CheA
MKFPDGPAQSEPALRTSEPADAFERRLQAIFADEARTHLARLDAGLARFAAAGAPQQAALAAPILEALHTLAGAARSVELGELEWLCRALESVFAAAGSGPGLTAAQLGLVRPAVGVAGTLLEKPSLRARAHALALLGQLEALARQLAAPRPA